MRDGGQEYECFRMGPYFYVGVGNLFSLRATFPHDTPERGGKSWRQKWMGLLFFYWKLHSQPHTCQRFLKALMRTYLSIFHPGKEEALSQSKDTFQTDKGTWGEHQARLVRDKAKLEEFRPQGSPKGQIDLVGHIWTLGLSSPTPVVCDRNLRSVSFLQLSFFKDKNICPSSMVQSALFSIWLTFKYRNHCSNWLDLKWVYLLVVIVRCQTWYQEVCL